MTTCDYVSPLKRPYLKDFWLTLLQPSCAPHPATVQTTGQKHHTCKLLRLLVERGAEWQPCAALSPPSEPPSTLHPRTVEKLLPENGSAVTGGHFYKMPVLIMKLTWMGIRTYYVPARFLPILAGETTTCEGRSTINTNKVSTLPGTRSMLLCRVGEETRQ